MTFDSWWPLGVAFLVVGLVLWVGWHAARTRLVVVALVLGVGWMALGASWGEMEAAKSPPTYLVGSLVLGAAGWLWWREERHKND